MAGSSVYNPTNIRVVMNLIKSLIGADTKKVKPLIIKPENIIIITLYEALKRKYVDELKVLVETYPYLEVGNMSI